MYWELFKNGKIHKDCTTLLLAGRGKSLDFRQGLRSLCGKEGRGGRRTEKKAVIKNIKGEYVKEGITDNKRKQTISKDIKDTVL